ncbi:hypothetical protein ACFGWI_06830 [Pasteurella multocida]
MRLFSCKWFRQLVVFFAFISLSTFSYSRELWSSVGYWYYKKDLSNDNAITQIDCDLSKFSGTKKTDGDPNAPRIDIRTKIDSSGIVTDYGDGDKPFLGDGIFRYAEKIEFSKNLSKGQGDTGSRALKKALQNGNCDIADALLNSMTNPQFIGDEALAIQNGSERCVITKDGQSRCKFNKSELGPDGKPKITICGEENCHEGTLDEYASSSDRTGSNPPSNSNNNSPIKETEGSSGTGSTGSGSGNSNGSSSSGSQSNGTNQGSQGNKEGGTGVGNGKGNGEGDNEGDGKSDIDKPNLQDFDIKSAFSGLKESLKDFIPDLSMPSGSCPTVSIPVFNSIHSIDVHCQIFDKNGGKISAIFSLIWGFIVIRILLSA